MSLDFKKDDIVLLSGTTQSGKGITKVHRCLGRIVEVGKYDLFVILTGDSEYNKPFRMPKKRCQKVDIELSDLSAEVREPSIGDLVLSVTCYFSKVDQKVGRLKKIIHKPGTNKQAVIMESTKEHIVFYDSLIVLEH